MLQKEYMKHQGSATQWKDGGDDLQKKTYESEHGLDGLQESIRHGVTLLDTRFDARIDVYRDGR